MAMYSLEVSIMNRKGVDIHEKTCSDGSIAMWFMAIRSEVVWFGGSTRCLVQVLWLCKRMGNRAVAARCIGCVNVKKRHSGFRKCRSVSVVKVSQKEVRGKLGFGNTLCNSCYFRPCLSRSGKHIYLDCRCGKYQSQKG